MMGPIPSGPALPVRGAAKPVGGAGDAPAIRDAARQFESLLLGQILKSARQSAGGGWLDDGGDQAGAVATEIAEERFAQALAQSGGLGLTEMIVSGMSRR